MKKTFLRVLSFALCALLLAGSALPALPVWAAGTNIARGKTAIACHSESASLTPDKALDGRSDTRFAAGGGCSHDTWYVLDLGDRYDLSRVRINWEAAHPSRYILEISDDGRSFSELKTVNTSAAGWVETAVSGTGRFLRIRELTRALDAYGFSMWDLEVYGEAAAKGDNAAYHVVSAGDIRGGSLTLSHTGFVREGTEVTVTAAPVEGGSLASLTLNGTDVTADVKNGVYTFTVTGKTDVEAAFRTPPGTRFECEDVPVLAPDGVTPYTIPRLSDPDASGDAVAGGTGGKYFVFENVAESNCIHVAYASTNTNSMSLYIRYPWEEDFHEAGTIPFSTSNSWEMKSSYIAVSPLIYIPEGSDIKLRPNVDCNLDRLWVTNEAAARPSDAPANTLPAHRLSDGAAEDIMATYAKTLHLTAGERVDFTVPAVGADFNVFSLSYRAEGSAAVSLTRGDETLGALTLGATPLRGYMGAGMRTEDYAPGETLTLTVTEGELWLDFVTVNYAPTPETVTVGAMPATGERLTVSLNGTWAFGAGTLNRVGEVPETVPETVAFVNSIPVPGLWSSAAYDMGDYTSALSWYKKTVVLEEAPTGEALLYIGSAQYSRHIYVNGRLVGSYDYNYSHSYTDVSDHLVKGKNEIVIMLGSWSGQSADPDTKGHLLFDGESIKDEPGITDRVSLIFTATPEVQAVQTNPHIDKGTVQVQVTLRNRSDKTVTTDVTIAVYELGVFENGVPNQTEVKVGEYTQKAVRVSGGKTATFTVDAISLENWSRDKCWSPDSPFLYRVEVRTAGDTYTTRFGMRTFDFDPVTKYARLNGEIFYLFGTNVAIERYFDDPLCGTTPWQEDWIRKLYSEYKDVNWSCFRTHLGHANSLWFELADEMGLMIFDEYATWGDVDGCTVDSIMPEIYAWIDARANHPSMIVFDAQNEALGTVMTDEIIRRGREYDLQRRPWDNGWRPPVGENDPVECHPYIIGGRGISGLNGMNVSTPIVTTADIGWTYSDYPDHPYLVNEHGEYWINREGAAMSGTAGTWNSALPNATNEERLTYYAELMAAQMEAFRTERAYVGLLFFCGLGSSFPSAQGVTSDILSPDVSTPESLEIRPYTKALLKNAFSDLGIVIDEYTESVRRGDRIRLPITLVNDTGAAVTDLPVTLRIRSGDLVIYEETVTMSVEAFSGGKTGVATRHMTVKVPAYEGYCEDGTTLVVTASYELNGEEVFSQRKWRVRGGDAPEGEPPVYDTDTAETQPAEPPAPDTPAATEAPATEAPATQGVDPSDSPAATEGEGKKGCRSALGMGCIPVLLACGLVLSKKRERFFL